VRRRNQIAKALKNNSRYI